MLLSLQRYHDRCNILFLSSGLWNDKTHFFFSHWLWYFVMAARRCTLMCSQQQVTVLNIYRWRLPLTFALLSKTWYPRRHFYLSALKIYQEKLPENGKEQRLIVPPPARYMTLVNLRDLVPCLHSMSAEVTVAAVATTSSPWYMRTHRQLASPLPFRTTIGRF